MPFNKVFDELADAKELFNYKCNPDDQKSKYEAFCTPVEAKERIYHCSQDYTFMTHCSENLLENGCHKRSASASKNCLDETTVDKYASKIEHRGPDARCFYYEDYKSAKCLRYKILNGKVAVVVQNNEFVCEYEGQILDVIYKESEYFKSHYKVRCPDNAKFIKYSQKTSCNNQCFNNGFCSNGKCICFSGYDPKDDCKSKLFEQDYEKLFTLHLKKK